MRNSNKSFKSHIPQWWGKWKSGPKSVSRTDHYQKLNSSFDWYAQIITEVSVKSADYFFSNPAHRLTIDRQHRPENLLGGGNYHSWYSSWIYMKFLSNVGLNPDSRWFHFGGDPDWHSLSFRGHSRPARSFRHKIDCCAETVRDTAKVTMEH